MPTPILVVDDDAAIRQLLFTALESEGYTVSLARHGREALLRIAEQRPSLILLDLNMPVMDGWTLHATLRAQHAAIPVVFMTAGYQACREAERHGADGGLAKPFELDEVLQLVERFAA